MASWNPEMDRIILAREKERDDRIRDLEQEELDHDRELDRRFDHE